MPNLILITKPLNYRLNPHFSDRANKDYQQQHLFMFTFTENKYGVPEKHNIQEIFDPLQWESMDGTVWLII